MKHIMWTLEMYGLVSLLAVAASQSNYESGRGIWSLINAEKCEEELKTVHLSLEITKSRVNRTHDGLAVTVDAATDIHDGYGIFIHVCKYMDGGCKPFQNITALSFANFIKAQFKSNIPRFLKAANIDPPDFPIPEGQYTVNDFIIDYCEITNDSIYGKFEGTVYMLINNEKVSCFTAVVEFNKLDDEDDDVCNGSQ